VSRASSWCSPAERAGLRGIDFDTAALGDVIVVVDDKTVRRLSDLTDELERNGVGKTVPLTVQGRSDRNGRNG
jgi:S1-C subfamily serine protease